MRILALALITALCTTGCSFITAHAPDTDRPPDQTPRCNEGKGAVAVDGLIGASLLIGGLSIVGDEPGAGALLGLTGALYAGAAAYGNSSANKCRQAYTAYELAEAEREDRERFGGLPGAPTRPAAGPGATSPGRPTAAAPTRPGPRPTPARPTASGRPDTAMVPVRAAPPPVVVQRPPAPPEDARLGAADDSGDDGGDDGDDGDDAAAGDHTAPPPAPGDRADPWRNFWVEVE